jgi:hypothetical protein
MNPGNERTPETATSGATSSTGTTPASPTTVTERSDVPHVVAVRVVPCGATRQVAVRCPHCRRWHHHGWPLTCDRPGHRLAHCGRGGYFVEVAP